MTEHIVRYGKAKITFELERKDVKNINLNIRANMRIVVSASDQIPLEFIKEFVREKAPWILKNIDYFKEVQPERRSPREYVSGESFKYLGKQYRLQVEQSQEEYVKYFRGYIYLYTKDICNLERKEQLFHHWLDKRAQIVFQESLNKMHKLVSKYDIPKPKLNTREMKSRWGSCVKEINQITLNCHLIKAPKYCIDYVVLHELIHLKYNNHSNQFYLFLTSLMPDWGKRKQILDTEIIREL